MIAEENTAVEESKPKRYRLVVRSAEEAVRMIREKLGDHAKVVSVRQFGGEGLKRFISSPKLEVIAEVSKNDPISTEDKESELSFPSDETGTIDGSITEASSSSINSSKKDLANESNEEKNKVSTENTDALSLLAKAGFDASLIDQIKLWPEIGKLDNLPLADVLRQVTLCLSDRFKSIPSVPMDSKIGLLGSPGSGKTTILCKLLAQEVFIKKTTPMVLKLENGVPNPDDSLRIFCEVIGVTLYREAEKVPPPSLNTPLYIDLPGISLSDISDWTAIKSSLENLGVGSKILVVNGAYDSRVLNKCIRTGVNLGATHLAISHFDELSNASKLWPILFDSGLSPYCISSGQNVTGDFSQNVLNQMIAKSFPEDLYSQTFTSYQKA